MLVLEATSTKQGDRDGDYHWCSDGELAYKPGIDCSSPDCGCGRGWAGFDSHQATTTVQVVDRPEFTIDLLAKELAVSLADGGWLDAADATDEMVSSFVDEIIEIANHFGEGAVLERDGDWTKVRTHDLGPVNPLDRVVLEQLTEDLFEMSPMSILAFAASNIHGAGSFVGPLVGTLVEADWPEAHALGCAIDWLANSELTYTWPKAPDWLRELNHAEVTAARRRNGNDGKGYLTAISVNGLELGTASCYVMDEGHIDSFFAIPDSIENYTKLMKNVQRRSYKPFNRIAVSTAFNELTQAGRVPFESKGVGKQPNTMWPNNRPLFDFIVDQMTWIVR